MIWSFTDLDSWILYFSKYQKDMAPPLDWLYEYKPAYRYMQEDLTRVLPDGIDQIVSKIFDRDCFEAKEVYGYNPVRIRDNGCSGTDHTWNITWQDDGTY